MIPVVVSITLLVIVGMAARRHLPEHLDPWAPLRIDAPPNFLTRYKLQQASADAQACRAALAQTQWQYTPIDDEQTRPGCGYFNAVRIQRMSFGLNAPFAVSCREALSLALWEKHVVQPAAQTYFQAPVDRLEHFGSYACRSVYGRPKANLSHHATADALDVAGFVIGGKRIRVVSDWDQQDAAGQFLRDVHAGACRYFDSVFGPGYNAAHRDHFHLDRGRFRACR